MRIVLRLRTMAPKKPHGKVVKVSVFLDEALRRQVAAAAALRGETTSQWLAKLAALEIGSIPKKETK